MTWKKKDDIDSIEIYVSFIKNNALRNRIQCCLKWTISKAWRFLYIHVSLTIISIILNLSIPVLICWSNCDKPYSIIITIVSGLSSGIITILETTQTKKLWQMYRVSAEKIKSECMSLNMNEITEEALTKNVEETMNNIHNSWEKLFTKL